MNLYADTDRVPCPHCGELITDLWELFLHSEVAEIECCSCDRELVIIEHTSVTYEVRAAA